MENLSRLRGFIQDFTQLIEEHGHQNEKVIFSQGKALLTDLVQQDDWLPAPFAKAHPEHYQQYLLYCDPLERFSIVSFVWGPGQSTSIHDHTVWGMVGILRGAERCEEFTVNENGLSPCGQHELPVGAIDVVSPKVGDIHRVTNALYDQVSISIHIYGANIGAISRHTYDLNNGQTSAFISGYSSPLTPNRWDRSNEAKLVTE